METHSKETTKAIYKRWWFIVLMIIISISIPIIIFEIACIAVAPVILVLELILALLIYVLVKAVKRKNNPKRYKGVKIKQKNNRRNQNKLNVSKEYNNEYNCNVDNYYEKLHYYDKPKNIDSVIHKNKYMLSQITDTEVKVTVEKIQELYNELGFRVKVIDIVKKKYITEYEIIFSRNITQSDILSVSDKIIEEFQIDGVKVIRNSKKENRIYIQIPLKYEKTLT